MAIDIEQHLTSHGVNPTAMRQLVYRTLMQSTQPLSLKQIEEHIGTADKSTICRALNLFLKHHLLHAIEDGSGAVKYEPCTQTQHTTHDDQHVHFHCQQCQHTFCLHNIHIPHINLPPTLQIESINYIVKGICPACQNKNKSV